MEKLPLLSTSLPPKLLLLQLTIVTPKRQPREDGPTKGAQTGIVEESGVIEGCWGTADKKDRQS